MDRPKRIFFSIRKRPFIWFAALSIFLHVLFIGFAPEGLFTAIQREEKPTEVLKISLKSSDRPRQIVRSEESSSTEKASDSKYLSDKDRLFDREVVSKNIGRFKHAAIGRPDGTADQQKKKKASKLSLDDFSFQKISAHSKSLETKKGLENGKKGERGLAANNDYLEEIPLGDFTRLNTSEFKYYGFYHRIRQQLEQHWESRLQEKAIIMQKIGRRLASNEKNITSLQVTIDQFGKIKEVFLKSTSGVKELDDAAIESFNRAGPFPNPPAGLLINGLATIEWGFVVKS